MYPVVSHSGYSRELLCAIGNYCVHHLKLFIQLVRDHLAREWSGRPMRLAFFGGIWGTNVARRASDIQWSVPWHRREQLHHWGVYNNDKATQATDYVTTQKLFRQIMPSYPTVPYDGSPLNRRAQTHNSVNSGLPVFRLPRVPLTKDRLVKGKTRKMIKNNP